VLMPTLILTAAEAGGDGSPTSSGNAKKTR
jgi:hypothetical protein